MRSRKHTTATGVLVLFVAFGVGVTVAPQWTARALAKEGPVEVVSHAVLLVAVLAWLLAAWRRHTRARALAVGVAVFCAVVLGEELSWGAELGVTMLADPLSAATGRADFHNAWGGASYLVFAVPVVALVVIGIVASAQTLPLGIDRDDAVALGLVGLAAIGGTLAWPSLEAQLDELSELALYVALTWIAVRRRPED